MFAFIIINCISKYSLSQFIIGILPAALFYVRHRIIYASILCHCICDTLFTLTFQITGYTLAV